MFVVEVVVATGMGIMLVPHAKKGRARGRSVMAALEKRVAELPLFLRFLDLPLL